MRILLTFLAALLIIGCQSNPSKYDQGWKMMLPLNYQSKVHAEALLTEKRDRQIVIKAWKIRLVNTSNTDYCATARWQLFEFINNTDSGWIFVPANIYTDVGYMVQSPWQLDDTTSIYLSPAGFLQSIWLRKPAGMLKCNFSESL